MASLAIFIAGQEEASATSHYIPHNRIVIDGNDDFTTANGVSGGSGTPSDPYVIEGWIIDDSTGNGIEIRNTTAFLIIRDVFLNPFGGTSSSAGIYLENVMNILVEEATISEYLHGIHVLLASEIVIASSAISFNDGAGGVRVELSDHVTVVNNKFSVNGAGVFLAWSTNTTISSNVFNLDGVFLVGSDTSHYTTHTITRDNVVNGRPLYFYKNCSGLDVEGVQVGQLIVANCKDVRIANLQIAGTDVGLLMAFVDGATITGNTFVSNSPFGIYLTGSPNVRVHHNNFIASDVFDNHGKDNSWDDGYPSGGNYWSAYAGVDNCSDPEQDVCPDPDGIGDTPFVIDFDSQLHRDNYPLMEPYVPTAPSPAPDPVLVALILLLAAAVAVLLVLLLRGRKHIVSKTRDHEPQAE